MNAGFNKRELHILVNLNKKMLEAAGINDQEIEPTLDGFSGPEGRRRGGRG